MGKLVGLKVFAVIIGYGKKLVEFEIFGIPVELNLKPFNGLTYAFPENYSWIKTRLWFFNLGGLLTHMAFITIFIIFGGIDFSSLIISFVSRFAFLETFLLANIFVFVINAFPYKIQMPQGSHFSDGYKIFQIPFMKFEQIIAMEKVQERLIAWNLLRKGKFKEAIEVYEKLIAENPEDNLLRHDLAISKLKFESYEDARNLLVSLIETKEFENPQAKMILYNNIAWINAVIWNEDLLEESDKMSFEAYSSNPKMVNFIGTRGSVLVRLGKTAQGLELLKDSYGKISDNSGRSETACFIAIANAKLGKFKEASLWVEKARKNDSETRLIKIAEQEINRIKNDDL